MKPATALTTPTGRGIGIMAIDGIGGRGIGDGVTVKESGYTGITLVVKNLTVAAAWPRTAARVVRRMLPLKIQKCESHRSESSRGFADNRLSDLFSRIFDYLFFRLRRISAMPLSSVICSSCSLAR